MAHLNRRKNEETKVQFSNYDYFVPLTFFGLLAVIGSAILLWWGEHRYANHQSLFTELNQKLISAKPFPDPLNEGKPVLVIAPLIASKLLQPQHLHPIDYLRVHITQDTLTARGKVVVRRTQTLVASDPTFGGFDGSGLLQEILRLRGNKTIDLSPSLLIDPKGVELRGNRVLVTSGATINRFSYEGLASETYTVVGTQKGNRLLPFIAKNGQTVGLLITPGAETFDNLQRFQTKADAFYNLIFRTYGFIAMWLGTLCLLVPFRGRFVSLPFLSNYSRFLSLMIAVPTTALTSALLHTRTAWWMLLILLIALPLGWCVFIFYNRDTPRARRG